MQILVIEDDPKIAGFIADGLRQEGHEAWIAIDGETGLNAVLEVVPAFDAVVLDLMLPKRDGFSVLDAMRRQKVKVPVLMLSALDSVDDRVRGLRAGADDYLVKPFAFDELTARLLALVRRRVDRRRADAPFAGQPHPGPAHPACPTGQGGHRIATQGIRVAGIFSLQRRADR